TSCEDLSTNNGVFSYAGRLASRLTVNIGANVQKIPTCLFFPDSYFPDFPDLSTSAMPNITSVVFAEGSQCTSIGGSAFAYCGYLSNITIPEGVTSIGDSAFYNCSGLTSITIPKSITSIDSYAFAFCNLYEVYYTGTEEQWNAISIHKYGNDRLTDCNITYNYGVTQE
ncbi:MAG: leucine-rich repeat domain-containing protein, partial [Christensenellales bacterium]